MQKTMWYNPAQTLSHNCIWNMVLSMRGGGKTFGCLKLAINNWIKRKEKFIYLRRTDAELSLCKDHLMDAINAENIFPNFKFKVVGNDIYCNDNIIGYCIALSKAYQMKSVSYPDVSLIIFDEFLLEDKNGRYLPSEPNKVLALMETVGRMRNIKLIMLANYVSKANIYFDYWKMYPRADSTFTKHQTKPILIHFYSNETFKEEKAKTPFAKLIQDTAYGGYILDNNPINDNYTFVEEITGNNEYWFTIKWKGKGIGVRYHPQKGMVWFTEKVDTKSKNVFAFDTDSHSPNIMLLQTSRNHPMIKQMKTAIDYGIARFDNLGLKYNVLELLNYL